MSQTYREFSLLLLSFRYIIQKYISVRHIHINIHTTHYTYYLYYTHLYLCEIWKIRKIILKRRRRSVTPPFVRKNTDTKVGKQVGKVPHIPTYNMYAVRFVFCSFEFRNLNINRNSKSKISMYMRLYLYSDELYIFDYTTSTKSGLY